nr:UDP-glycosyltransferase 89B2-like [Lolium perenne]
MDAPLQTTSARNADGKPHVLVVPYPSQGHLVPLLDLAALLAARGLALTVAVTAGNAPLVAARLPFVATAVLPFPASPFLPAGCAEDSKELPAHLFRPFMASLAALLAPLLSWCKAQPRWVSAVISDLFTGWTLPLAEELGVPHVTFAPASVHYLATSLSLWRRMLTSRDDDDTVAFPDVPGSPSFAWRHLSLLFRMHVAGGDEVSDTIRQIFLWNLESCCFLANSLAALESAYMRDLLPDLAGKRVFAAGPLLEALHGGGGPSPPAKLDAWLGAFHDGSVVYVAFGTQQALLPAQVACVANALALSSAAFGWVLTSGTALPKGFEAATASRGVVIRGWVQQVEILRHPVVGWFLTHCGWNSVLEAAAAGWRCSRGR